MRRKTFICLVLITVTLAVFWQVSNHEFVNFDDDDYVSENPHVQSVLSRQAIIWAFTATRAANWHPLTWLSHMIDCQLYGLNPSGHHLTNVLFHLVNTLLLFLLLNRITGASWRSGFVAALFAVHPLHVESVAWVAERKDVLSTLFWLLTMWAYIYYVEKPRLHRYLLTLLTFALGLMAKPMLVTLPVVLLLLDYWPLKRIELGQSASGLPAASQPSTIAEKPGAQAFRLLLEKTPLFVLAVVSSVVTFIVQKSGGAVGALEVYPIKIRVANALVSYVSYMVKMIWPLNLAVFYPHPGQSLPMWQAAAAGLLFLLISIAVIRAGRRQPYLPVGWLWYLGTLVPVIGLVQVGAQAMADRYTYVPLIGLFIMAAWGVPELLAKYRFQRTVLATLATILLVTLTLVSKRQVRHWQNSLTLFQQAVEVTADNYVAHDSLGNALAQQGMLDQAIVHYRESLRIKPNLVNTHNNLGVALLQQGEINRAMAQYYQALRLKPDSAETHNNLGVALFTVGQLDQAIGHYLTAIKLDPNFGKAYNNLGNVLARKGKFDEAISQYSRALELKPNYPEAHNNLGVALAQQEKLREAIAHFKRALQLRPDYSQARSNLDNAIALLAKTTEPPGWSSTVGR
jgi:tetratricopeptide (TPR) repeat protein